MLLLPARFFLCMAKLLQYCKSKITEKKKKKKKDPKVKKKEEISKDLKYGSGLIRFQFSQDNLSGDFEDSFDEGGTNSMI